MFSLIANPLPASLLIFIFQGRSLSFQVHMYAIMRYADFILLPDHRLQHPRSEAIAGVGCPDYLGFLFIMGLSGATNFFTQDRLQTGFSVLLDDLLNSALRHFDIQ